jgi:hypothetical protein
MTLRPLLSLTFSLVLAATASAQWVLPEDFKIANPRDLEHAATKPAPSGAIVLFDGTSLDKWVKRNDGSPAKWTIANRAMEGVKGHGDIITKDQFDGTFILHVEFRVPYEPANKGQGRGNSGVYVQGRYEIQILDSYGLKSGKNDCGAIYNVAAPSQNVCKAPTIWQSYDIEFQAPKFENGRKTEPARLTVYHNGTKIHDAVAVPVDNTTAGLGGDPSRPGPILLQDHGHPVQFRNIWLLPRK